MEEKKIKTIKGFDKDLKCRDFQYGIGKTYEHKGNISICESGFHAIADDVSPFNVFCYYPPSVNGAKSRYCEVEAEGNIEIKEEKICASKLTVGAEIGIPGLVKAHVEWVKKNITNENNADKGEPATAGYRGAATAGEYGAATSKGSSSVGIKGLAVARGCDVKVRGGVGAILVIAVENDNNSDIKEWKAAVVDGYKIKADTWYKLENGEFVEVE